MKFNLITRTCPECENFGLEIRTDLNTFECIICGSIWKRIKPLNNGKKLVKIPKKLKKLLDQ